MQILLLGPVELCAEDGTPLDIGGAKRRAVLAALALEFDRVVPVSGLMQLAWEGEPPPRARAALQGHIAALRKALGDQGLQLLTQDAGYLLTGDAQRIDVHRFETLVTRASATDEPRIKAGLLRDALDLWRGSPLADLPPTDCRETVVGRLHEQYLRVIEAWAECELGLGRGGRAIPVLDTAVRAEGLRESLVRVLVLCLYQDGRQAEALDVYHQARERLADELGVEPGRGLREAFEQVLRAVPVPSAAPPAASAALPVVVPAARPEPAPAGRPVPRQLPRAVGGFVGRTDAAQWLDEVEAAEPGEPALAVVVGPAGVGKTALVVRWAHRAAERYPDGQLFADLQGFDERAPEEPGTVLGGFLRALGVPDAELPAGCAERSALFAELTLDRRLLVILDNVRDADDVCPLLPAGGGCTTVVTSRSALTRLIAQEGGAWLSLPLLAPEEAVQLLAAAIGVNRVEAEPETARQLVDLCDRLPLALRLSASRLAARPGWPIAHLVHEIADEQGRPGNLEHPGGAGVAAAIGLTCRLLPGNAAQLFALLGAHPGAEADTYSAAALLGCGVVEARRALGSLAGRHLVNESRPGHYSRHSLVELYCQQQLAQQYGPTGQQLAVARLLDYHLAASAAAARQLSPYPWLLAGPVEHHPVDLPPMPTNAAALAWFADQEPIIRALVSTALEHGEADRVWRLTENCCTLYYHLGHQGRWKAAAAVGLRAAERAGDPRAVLQMNRVLGLAEVGARSTAAGLAHLESAVRAADGDDWRLRLPAVMTLGQGLLVAGQSASAVAPLEEAIRLANGAAEARTAAAAHYHLAGVLIAAGDPQAALDHTRQGQRLIRDCPEADQVWLVYTEARALHALGRAEEALVPARRALDLSDRHGPVSQEAEIRRLLARLLVSLGRRVEAADHLVRAVALLDAAPYSARSEARRELAALVEAVAARPSWTDRS
ncbi:DNA-binding SARP family transcriptional activator/tetratricopeptide (TPR) repeat protein [Kitasatospora sp. MAA4]|uniref:AfsR/SARP family transcriptional regulator n=1 Tax=Kitasatospora sp. MAA4 TaxID=3035093 RepID=UPI0024762CCC|nr:BTAD domain-containing putative transcriptional regulator [Kitasatospora sp. MAA4]MDH6133744.1 DNA-binding SARP family transcriptional activator/tetratricopeptide (TPR) repeat protein [Kitasatospora sp. MAA4]